MVDYRYEARDSKGKRRKGTISAPNRQEAKAAIQEQRMILLSLKEESEEAKEERLSQEKLYGFTRQLAVLLRAGLPLFEALQAIEEQHRGEKSHRLFFSLTAAIKEGRSLSSALAIHPKNFDDLYRALVKAGEAVGSLGAMLEKVATLLASRMEMRKKWSGALLYPAILAAFSLIVIGLLLGFVIPSIETIFSERRLNDFSRLILRVSYVFRHFWWIYIPLFSLVTLGFIRWSRSEGGRKKIEKISLRLPLIGPLIIEGATTRFCRTMATLLEGGVVLNKALAISRQTVDNHLLREELLKMEERIVGGSSLSRELHRSLFFPKLAARMIGIGEEAGSLVPMLTTIAEIYESEVEKKLSRLMAASQPVILIVMGAIIGAVMLAILLPLSDLNSLNI